MVWQMERPSPIPLDLVLMKGWKSWSLIAADKPGPLRDRERRLRRIPLAEPRQPVHGQEVDRRRDPLPRGGAAGEEQGQERQDLR